MTPQHRQQLEELAKWHEEEADYLDGEGIEHLLRPIIEKHRNAAKLLREVVDEAKNI